MAPGRTAIVINAAPWRKNGSVPHVWCTFFTRRELETIMAPLGLSLTRDEPCVAYERDHASAGSWPPTPWYVNWAEGKNPFGDARAPLELRWLAYARIPA